MSGPPPGDGPKRPSRANIVIWVAVAAIGAYFVISGVVGVISG